MAKYLITVVGPTGIGKTSLSIELAEKYKTDIISADSRQVYKELNIGTAKPSRAELKKATHHFIGFRSIHDVYNAGKFERDVVQKLKDIYKQQDVAIMAGGSGLYIKAVLEGIDEYPDITKDIRNRLKKEFEQKGIAYLQQELKRMDPKYYEKVDTSNHHRIIRALEVCIATEKPFSSFHKKADVTGRLKKFEPILIGLNMEREELYHKINERTDKMIQAGLVKEAKKLYPFRSLNALQTVGYQELFDHFDGKCSLEDAIELIKQNTRKYAKRQLSWFRQDKSIQWFHPDKKQPIFNYLKNNYGI